MYVCVCGGGGSNRRGNEAIKKNSQCDISIKMLIKKDIRHFNLVFNCIFVFLSISYFRAELIKIGK